MAELKPGMIVEYYDGHLSYEPAWGSIGVIRRVIEGEPQFAVVEWIFPAPGEWIDKDNAGSWYSMNLRPLGGA
jgi:hypothetical protein